MSSLLEMDILLRGTPSDIAKCLRDSLERNDEGAVNAQLFEAVKAETIPPTVLPIWLSIVRRPSFLSAALGQDFSRYGRSSAIRWIGKWMTRSLESWHAIWDELGSAAGLVELLAGLSAQEVKYFLKVIGASSSINDGPKQVAVTELFQRLCSSSARVQMFPHVRVPNPDQRPFFPFYLDLLPACTEECVKAVLISHPVLVTRWPRSNKLLCSHTELMRTLYRQGYATKLPFLRRLCIDTPDRPGHDRGFTAPMSFVWSLAQEEPVAEHNKEHSNRLRWLLHKAFCRGMAIEKMLPIAEQTLQACGKSKSGFIALGPPAFLYDITSCWEISVRKNSNPDAWEALLSSALQLTKPSVLPVVIDLERPLLLVKAAYRYSLLRLYLSLHYDIDIENDGHLHRYKCKSALFSLLDRKHAVSLLERLIKARPECDFLVLGQSESTLLEADSSAESVYPSILKANFLGDDERLATIVSERIAAQKTKAERSRAQPERTLNTKTVIWWAAKSRSLKILEEVIVWLRRFVRDPLTVRELYWPNGVVSEKNVKILAAVPSRPISGSLETNLVKIQADVVLANQIIRNLLETMDMAMREPSYARPDWVHVRKLFSRVVCERMSRAEWLEKSLILPPDRVYDCVWQDTLKLYGSIAQRPEWSQHGQSRPEMNLTFVSQGVSGNKGLRSPSSLRFLDAVAIISNDTWERYRTLEKPVTAILPAPFAKGLPVKYLLSGATTKAGWSLQETPFVASKARAVALMDADVALSSVPSGGDMVSAIGIYVEDFRGAVDIYVNDDPTIEGRTQRLTQVWTHWRTVFRKEACMSAQDVALYLRSILSSVVRDDALEQVLESFEPLPPAYDDYPRLPKIDSGSETHEWDPAEFEPVTSDVEYEPKAIDCFMNSNPGRPDPNGGFSHPGHRKISREGPQFWHISRLETNKANVIGEVAEGVIASAMLCLDGKAAGRDRILAKSWPKEGPPRYPALYIDSAFLEYSDGILLLHTLDALSRYLKRVPTSLLVTLTGKYLSKFSSLPVASAQIADIESTAFRLLKLLSKSDRPLLACDLIIKSVLDNPDSSSWHRQLLRVGFLSTLSAEQTQSFVSEFVSEITVRWKKLAKGQQALVALPGPTSSVQPVPHVKVTTVKLLAELIRGANYISVASSTRILANLFEHASHVDIKIATLDALMEFMPKNASEVEGGIVEQIIPIIETAVPTISRFNEREALSEDDWNDALSSCSPPIPYAEVVSSNPPLAEKLMAQVFMPDEYERAYFERIVEPALTSSLKNKQRWLQIVLRKHGGDEVLADLAIPFTMSICETVLGTYQEYMTTEVLARLLNLRRAVKQPSSALQKMLTTLKSTAQIKNSPEGRYWLSEFDHSRSSPAGMRWPVFRPGRLLRIKHRETKRTDGRGITVVDLQRSFIREAEWLLEGPTTTPELAEFASLMELMEPSSAIHDIHSTVKEHIEAGTDWLANARPVLAELANLIESKRTPRWQRDPQRNPRFLPSSVWMSLYLLPFPFLNTFIGSESERCNIFAEAILTQCIQKAAPTSFTSPAFMLWSKIIKAVNWCKPEDTIRVACYLGGQIDNIKSSSSSSSSSNGNDNVTEEPIEMVSTTTTIFFCIYLADQLLNPSNQVLSSIIRRKGSALREQVRNVVQKWSLSHLEEIRVLGFNTLLRFGFSDDDDTDDDNQVLRRQGNQSP